MGFVSRSGWEANRPHRGRAAMGAILTELLRGNTEHGAPRALEVRPEGLHAQEILLPVNEAGELSLPASSLRRDPRRISRRIGADLHHVEPRTQDLVPDERLDACLRRVDLEPERC